MKDLLEPGEVLPPEDVDMDLDVEELGRAPGLGPLADLARGWLERGPDDAALGALAPELDPPRAAVFVQLVALNVAFRLRTDELLAALCARTAKGPAPRLEPSALGALLARTRSRRAALALIAASPLEPEARKSAEAAAVPPDVPLAGSRLHLFCDQETAAKALAATAKLRRFMLLRRRAGFVSVLEEGDAIPASFARQVASRAGIRRTLWAQVPPGELALLVLEGSRVVLDERGLAARIGAPLEQDDVVGELRARGVLDLDPAHYRGRVELRFQEAFGDPPRGSRVVMT